MKFNNGENSISLSRILCVEDDKDSCSLIEFMLRQEDDGCVVTSAQTAEEAIDLIEKQSFDLYILDYWLPEMTGVELCEKIRQTDKQTPILFFTAMARPADRAAGRAAGATEYLVKPNDLSNLTETVKRLIHESKTNSELIRNESKSNSASNYRAALKA